MTTSANSKTYVDYTTPAVDADWLNDVNNHVYNSPPTPFDGMTQTDIEDVKNHDYTGDMTAQIQTALDFQVTGSVGSFQVDLRDGRYPVTNTGTNVLEVQAGTKISGACLEGTILAVDVGSTATSIIKDAGNAAKMEIENIAIFGNYNTSATAGIDLGATIQFGTYGTLDNIMVRDLPNATAYKLDTNIAACGKLYSMDTQDGLVSHPGGSGLRVEALTPLGFSRYGAKLAEGDSIGFFEAEAPSSDDAIPLVLERGGSVDHFILSLQSGRQIKTPVQINDTYVDHYRIGPTVLFGEGTFGDTTTPAISSTCTGVGTRSLQDTTQTFRVDQFKGGAIWVQISGTWTYHRIESNDVNRIYIEGSAWPTAPSVGNAYKLDYFIKKASGGGYAHSESGSSYEVVGYNLSINNEARINALTVGLTGTPGPAPTIASATTIAPTRPISFVSGTTTVQTITAHSQFAIGGGRITLIPTGVFSWNTSGNIALAGTSVVSKALDMIYDVTTAKWYPSYT